METGSTNLVVVFPITTAAFGLRADWFEIFSPRLVRPSILLAVLFIVIFMGVLALKRFEGADFERKLWNVPVLLTIIIFWPVLVIGLKEIVDTFDTFLVVNVFGIPWNGFGFPEFGSISDLAMWPSAGIARLLPNLAYWVIYAFYLVFFFFYTVLGPLVLAKGILLDEIENFFEILKELVLLLMWQTTVVILVSFIMPSIVSGQPLPPRPGTNFYFMSLVLGVLIFFTPAITRKFGAQLQSAFVPLGFRWGGAMVGLAAVSRIGAPALNHLGMSSETIERVKPFGREVFKAEEFKRRYETRSKMRAQDEDRSDLERKLRQFESEERSARQMLSQVPENRENKLVELAKKAQREIEKSQNPES